MVIGIVLSRLSKNAKDYFAAGSHSPWWVSGLSLFMSFLSAATFVAWGGIAYSQGVVAITMQFTMCIGGMFVAYTLAPKWKKSGYLSAADFVKDRLGENIQKLYTILFLLFGLISTAGVLYAVAKLVYPIVGIDINMVILLLGLMIILYTSLGGLWAVLVTDVLQFVVLLSSVLIILPLTLEKTGGMKALNYLPIDHQKFVSEEYSLMFILLFTLYHFIYIGGNWAFVQRFTSVSKPIGAKNASRLFGLLYSFSPIIWMLPPLLYRAKFPEADVDPESIYFHICTWVMPAGLLGLMMAAMISATASTANTNLNLSAAIFTQDIYKNYIKKNAADEHYLKMGRMATAGLGLCILLLAMLVPAMGGLINLIMTIAAFASGAIMLPIIWSLYSKKLKGFDAFLITIISLTIDISVKFIVPAMLNWQPTKAHEMGVGILFPLFFLITVELNRKPIHGIGPKKPLEEEKQIVKEGKADTAQNYALNVLLIGITVVGITILILGNLKAFSISATLIGTFWIILSAFGKLKWIK